MSSLRVIIFIILTLGSNISAAQILPADRQVDWSLAGLKDSSTINFTSINLIDFGIAGSGIIANDELLNVALSMINNEEGLIIKFPAGDFLFNEPIVLNSNIIMTGEGVDNTRLVFDLGGTDHAVKAEGTIDNSNEVAVVVAASKDQDFLEVSDENIFQIGDWIQINQIDTSLVTSAWAEGTVGQITQIENIEENKLFLSSPLRRTYLLDNEPTVTKINPVENIGISCLKIERLDDTAPFQGSNIFFNYAVNSWVSAIESVNCTFSHIQTRFSSNIKIEKSYLHDAFDFGGGGRAYGVMIHFLSNEILVENNIFGKLRHAMILQAGANGNVCAYNYSFDPFWTTTSLPSDAAGDIVLHGNYVYANLFEQNIVQNMVIDNSHGPNGPNNTFLRNRGESFGIFFSATNSPGQNFIANEVTNMESPYSLVNYTLQGDDHFVVGNNNKGEIHPIDSDTVSIYSMYYSERPDFVSEEQWGNIGLPNPFNEGSIPAQDRLLLDHPFLNTCEVVLSHTNQIYNSKEQVILYPIPTNSLITVESDSPIFKTELFGLSGKFIQEQIFENKTIELDLSELEDGIYFVKIYFETGIPILKKIVKMSN